MQAALDAAATGLLHAAPVLERLGHQAPGGDADDGLVEVLHFDGVQGDVHHVAIGAHLGHFDPVAHAQHVVAGQLNAGDERQQGVLVHQQDDRRHGAQARQQQQRRAVDQGGDDDDGSEDVQDHLRQLHVTLDGAGAGVFGARVDVQQGVEQGAQGQHHEQDGHGQGQVADEMLGLVAEYRHQVEAELDDQRRHGLGQAVEDLVVQQVVEPVQRRLSAQQLHGVQHQEARQAAQYQGDDQQQGQTDAGVQQRMLVESAPQGLRLEPEVLNIHGLQPVSSVESADH